MVKRTGTNFSKGLKGERRLDLEYVTKSSSGFQSGGKILRKSGEKT